MTIAIRGKPVVAGAASGELLQSSEPLSFWGGYNQETGEIIDRHHPLSGRNAAGKLLAIPYTRGSSTTTAVLLEAVRRKTAPAAILTTGIDPFLALASIVADAMYSEAFPVVALERESFEALEGVQKLRLDENGNIEIEIDTD